VSTPPPILASVSQSAASWRLLDPLSMVFSPQARAQRVVTLIIACALMSMGDLYMTLTYVSTVGMVEVNPLARALMGLGSAWWIVAWKVALTLLGAGILIWFRRRRGTELAAWVVACAMTLLTLHWVSFSAQAAEMADEYHLLANIGDDRFVQMDD
jgi:hypothetical protein